MHLKYEAYLSHHNHHLATPPGVIVDTHIVTFQIQRSVRLSYECCSIANFSSKAKIQQTSRLNLIEQVFDGDFTRCYYEFCGHLQPPYLFGKKASARENQRKYTSTRLQCISEAFICALPFPLDFTLNFIFRRLLAHNQIYTFRSCSVSKVESYKLEGYLILMRSFKELG